MGVDDYRLTQVSDFFYLLDDSHLRGKTILQQRFKKDKEALRALYLLIEKLDEMGYVSAVEFAFGSERFKTIQGASLGIIEIRKIKRLWRVLAYWDKDARAFVMLDAFEAHKHTQMSEMIRRVEPLALRAAELIEGND